MAIKLHATLAIAGILGLAIPGTVARGNDGGRGSAQHAIQRSDGRRNVIAGRCDGDNNTAGRHDPYYDNQQSGSLEVCASQGNER